MLGSHGLEYKNVPYEEASRIPLLMRYPRKLAAGARQDFLVSNVDLMPTMLAMCGANVPEGVQGRNHASLLQTGKGERPESVFSEGKIGGEGEWRMLVRGFDKLVLDKTGEVSHLYNLSQDPFEQNNLAASRSHMRTRDELLALIGDWQRQLQDGRSPSGLRKRP
jgi:arylsulfatase A-like enzyme